MLSAMIAPTMDAPRPAPTPAPVPVSAPAPTGTRTALPMTFTPTKLPSTVAPFTCVSNVCTGTGPSDFYFRLLQNLINMGNAQLVRKALASGPTIAVDGRLDQRTLNSYFPISRAVGGKLAIFDFTPDAKYLATNARAFAGEIAKWLGLTWVEGTTTVPGHWERMRVGQTVSVLPLPPITCPPGIPSSGQNCLWPSGTVTTFNPHRRKWRIAIPVGAGGLRPAPLPTPPPPPLPASPRGGLAHGFGWYGFGAASHVIIAETDTPPTGVKQVSEGDFATMSGEAAPSTTTTTAPPPPQQIVTAPPPPARVDVGPTTVVEPVTPTAAAPTDIFLPGTAPTSKRYAGCIARFNKTRKVFAIYCPINSAAATPGLGIADEFRCLYGDCGLGADGVTPPVPSGFTKTAEAKTLPGAGETPAGDEKDKFFRARNPMMWILLAGTAAAVGGGGYWFMRRRRKSGFGAACPKGQTWLESRGVCVDSKAYWDNPKRVLRKLGPRKRAA